MAGLNFKISAVDHKVAAKNDQRDTRSNVGKFFQKFDQQTGKVEPLDVVPINCSTQTPKEQGIKAGAIVGLPLYVNYKGLVPTFSGASKGGDQIVIGRRAPFGRKGQPGGSPGSTGILVSISDLPELAQSILDLHKSLAPQMPAIRASMGLAATSVPPTTNRAATTDEVADLDSALDNE